MKFSIITPVHVWHEDKIKQLKRCVNSVRNQNFKDFEHILIDDGSTLEIPDNIKKHCVYKKFKHNERVVSINSGLRIATGDWICFLDSDDEYFSYTLEVMSQMIEKNPEYKMFNAGSCHINRNWFVSLRGPAELKKLKVGHESFGKGRIEHGTYFFHRTIYEEIGGFPGDENGLIKNIDCSEINYGKIRDLYMGTPYDFSAAAQLEFPDMRQYSMVDYVNEPNKIIKELGNPWGQDYYFFYKYTRKYHSKSYNIPVVIINHDGKKKGEYYELKD